MSHSEIEIKSYLKKIFNFDEEEELNEIISLRSSFLGTQLNHSLDYDHRNQSWFVWKEQFENILPEFWNEDEEKSKDLLELFNFLESHPYDKFQNYTFRFKRLFENRKDLLLFDKKNFNNVQPRKLLDIFWGSKKDTQVAKNLLLKECLSKFKMRAYKNLIDDFKCEFPAIYQQEEAFFSILKSNVKKLKKNKKVNKSGSSESSYWWVGGIALYIFIKACSEITK